MNRPQNRSRSERGSAVPFALMVVGVLVTVTLALAFVGSVLVDHRRAQAAADLTALAGALFGCPAATQVAGANGALLTSCIDDEMAVTVVVSVGHARARARAGGL